MELEVSKNGRDCASEGGEGERQRERERAGVRESNFDCSSPACFRQLIAPHKNCASPSSWGWTSYLSLRSCYAHTTATTTTTPATTTTTTTAATTQTERRNRGTDSRSSDRLSEVESQTDKLKQVDWLFIVHLSLTFLSLAPPLAWWISLERLHPS